MLAGVMPCQPALNSSVTRLVCKSVHDEFIVT
jgi:hypothetical protein